MEEPARTAAGARQAFAGALRELRGAHRSSRDRCRRSRSLPPTASSSWLAPVAPCNWCWRLDPTQERWNQRAKNDRREVPLHTLQLCLLSSKPGTCSACLERAICYKMSLPCQELLL